VKALANAISFFVEGTPVPKERPRIIQKKSGSSFAYTPKRTKEWEEIIAWAGLQKIKKPLEGPLRVELLFLLPKPKKTKNAYPIFKSDVDNLSKSTIDALNGIAFLDDGQIIELYVRKQYGDRVGVEIHIEPI